MELLERIYNSLLLTESVSVDEVNDALDNHTVIQLHVFHLGNFSD